MRAWAALFGAIALEVMGTLSLKLSPEILWFIPYLLLACSYVLLSRAFSRIAVAVAFVIWEATGLFLITLCGLLWFGEHLSATQWLGLAGLLLGAALLHVGQRHATQVASPAQAVKSRSMTNARTKPRAAEPLSTAGAAS